jgi:hypothetical protein
VVETNSAQSMGEIRAAGIVIRLRSGQIGWRFADLIDPLGSNDGRASDVQNEEKTFRFPSVFLPIG